jgi:NTP pyrophosphatase (non-canonical NTP hydrolase)
LEAWSAHNFPGRTSVQPLLGVVEEVGELSHAYLKRQQGIRGTAEEHTAAVEDAVADIVIFLADFCNAEGIDLEATVERVWDTEVKPRDWRPATLDT